MTPGDLLLRDRPARVDTPVAPEEDPQREEVQSDATAERSPAKLPQRNGRWVSAQREEFHPVSEILRLGRACNQLQVSDALADGNPQLVGIDQTGEVSAASLPSRRLAEQIDVLGHQDASQRARAVQESRIREGGCLVFLGRQNVDAPETKAVSDGPRDVYVHIERDAHARRPAIRSRLRTGDLLTAAARASLSLSWRSISSSISAS